MRDLTYRLRFIFQWIALSKYISFLEKKHQTSHTDIKISHVEKIAGIRSADCHRYCKSYWIAHTSISLEDIDDAISSSIASSSKIHQRISDIPKEVELFSGYITNVLLTEAKGVVASVTFYLKTQNLCV